MRRLTFVAIAITLLFLAGCAQKKVVTKPTPPVQEEKKAEEIKKPEPVAPEVKKPEPEVKEVQKVEAEKVTEEQIAAKEKAVAATPEVTPPTPERQFIAHAKAACEPDPASNPVFDSIYFDYDSYAITPSAAATLKDLSSYLTKNKTKIHIEGHADERGTTEYNLALGEKRASAAKKYLLQMGIASADIEVVSCGEEQPVCNAKTEECWAKNRRARFVVIK